MAAAAPPDGQEKVIAAAQHIVKSLASSKNAADDMIRILSGFDNRLSLMSDLFTPPPAAAAVGSILEADEGTQREGDEADYDEDDAAARAEAEWDVAAEVVERRVSPAAGEALVFDSREGAEEYLAAVACLVGAPGPRAEAALQAAMTRLEDEFRHLLVRGAPPLAPEDLQASLLRRLSLTVPSFNSSAVDLDCHSFAHHPAAVGGDEQQCGRSSASEAPTTRPRPTSWPRTPSAPSGTLPTSCCGRATRPSCARSTGRRAGTRSWNASPCSGSTR
jgi:exocyst complex component 7